MKRQQNSKSLHEKERQQNSKILHVKERKKATMKETVWAKFAEVFGSVEGARVFFAPGRVNLIG